MQMSHFSLYSQFFLGQTNGFGGTVEIWIEFKISSGLWEETFWELQSSENLSNLGTSSENR